MEEVTMSLIWFRYFRRIIFLSSLLFITLVVHAQEDQTQSKSQVLLVDDILNDFESAEDWRAFATSPLGETKVQAKIQLGAIRDGYDPSNLTPAEQNLFKEGQNRILGVKTYFKDRGFDRVEIKPPHEYVIKGICKQISLWVLGRNYRHTLYIKLRDYRGKLYKLRVGRLNFFGWRKMILTIPGWLKQSARFSLFDRNLKFVSIFVESDNKEIGGTFYFYVDNLGMKIDKTQPTYPGNEIRDLW